MDHITRCPNCSTAFRVTDEQLAAYQGKVRCGRCSLVFNARDSLLQPPEVAAAPVPKPIAEPVTAPVPEPVAAPEPASSSLPDPVEIADHDAILPDENEPAAAIAPITAEAPVEDVEPASEAVESPASWTPPSLAELYSQTQEDIVAVEAEATPVADPETPETSAPDKIEDQAPDALMHTSEAEPTPEEIEARTAVLGSYRPISLPEDEALFAPLAKPRHARLWTFFALLAALVLVLQILFAYRVNIAMELPALQPRLAKLCQTLHCNMPLPRQAEQLRLEWSELTYVPDHPTLIQMSATLRNLAQFEQGLPQLEITLTDPQERVVARRVFRPAEYLTSSEKTRRSLLGYDELHAFLQLEIGDLKSTGYSLYWFYD